MNFETRNPATGELVQQFDLLSDSDLDQRLEAAFAAAKAWGKTSFAERAALLNAIADEVEKQRLQLAETISLEMGKLLPEALGEVDKCMACCRHYAVHAEGMLQDDLIETPAQKTMVAYQPLGVVFAVMPWNFPLWQVFRCMVPALMAGNGIMLKHAPNVPRCAKAVEDLLANVSAPVGLFSDVKISVEQAARVIADQRISGVAFTGSENTGRKIAALAGQNLKKAVLELGGSDPLIILDDANLEQALEVAVRSRYSNAGQICIASKRFLVVPGLINEFTELLVERVKAFKLGDPLAEGTTMAPMARADLRETVDRQVQQSISEGAQVLLGAEMVAGDGFYYAPTVLTEVSKGNTAFDDEIFGPVASIVAVRDEADAIEQANATRFGLGASVWTDDIERGEAVIRQLDVGCGFLNAQVASDLRVPFGGVKASGLGRELGVNGIREFCNSKSIWIA